MEGQWYKFRERWSQVPIPSSIFSVQGKWTFFHVTHPTESTSQHTN